MSTSRNNGFLFWASFFTLIAAGMGFSIRGDIQAEWGAKFGFTQTDLGKITGMGLFGFGITIIVFSFFADVLGYGKLMIIAFTLHVLSVVATLMAPFAYQEYGKPGAYWCLYIGQLCFSLANGTCEAVINPLTASLYPNNKTHWLNILHAGWPGGLVLGALVSLGLNQVGDVGWQIRWAIILVPMLLYGAMMLGRPFPKSEAKMSGVSLRQMMGVVGLLGMAVVCLLIGYWLSGLLPTFDKSIPSWSGWALAGVIWLVYGAACGFSPGHVLLTCLYVCHALVGYVELGTDSWIIDITKTVLANKTMALIAFIWTNVLMFTLRFFAGPIVHRISPLGLLFVSAVLGTLGLVMLGMSFTDSTALWLIAVTIYGLGKTFYWPTMLGVVSERYPKGGALALGFSGGIGMLCAGLLGGPGIGYKQDYFAVQKLQETAPETYSRYQAMKEKEDDQGKPVKDASGNPVYVPDEKGFLEFTKLFPTVTGLDGAKVNTLLGDPGENNGKGAKLETDIKNLTSKGGKLEDDKNLKGLAEWWATVGLPNADKDTKPLQDARYFGGKQALLYTAAVPGALVIGYLLMILYFRAIGGYRQVHIDVAHESGHA